MLSAFNPDDLGGLRVRLAKFHPSGTTRLGIMLDFNPLRPTTNSLTGTIGGSNINLHDQQREEVNYGVDNGNGSTAPIKVRRNSNGRNVHKTPNGGSKGKPPLSPASVSYTHLTLPTN